MTKDMVRKIVLVAQSARMLSRLAFDNGWLPIAVDCYADQDTRALALETLRVDSLQVADLAPLLRDIVRRHGVGALIYGSGFETCPDSLEMLQRDWQMLGNDAELFRRLQDKREFFARLSELGISFPAIKFLPPPILAGWLFKPSQGQGGLGVVGAELLSGNVQTGYWQQRLEGEVCSLLFVADGAQARILGWNQQWSLARDAQAPFLFAGIHNQARLTATMRRRLASWLASLMTVYPLRGLGSLDFIVQDEQCHVLEINPRIPASAQLYGPKVFAWHVQACQTGLISRQKLYVRPRAYLVVFAAAELRVPAVEWPNWAVDLPVAGAIIGQGQPICSIIAGGKNPAHLRMRLQRRQQIIEQLLTIRTLNSHAIPGKRQ